MRAAFALLSATSALAVNLLITNDDGWATAQVRREFELLTGAGHNVVLSAPAINQSGKGSSSTTPKPLTEPCEFNTCAAGSPAFGFNASDPRLNYVNGYPVDAANYGIKTLAPKFFNGAAPDLVVSGANVGSNLNLVVFFSGTVGAASESAKQGVPAVAFSGASGAQVSYTTLETDPTAASSLTANIYGELVTKFVAALTSQPGPFLPPGVFLNVNFARIDNCPSAANYQWVFSRLVWNPLATDVTTCGSKHLPDELTVIGKGCYGSVTVLDANTKLDVDAKVQAVVRDRLAAALPLTCLP